MSKSFSFIFSALVLTVSAFAAPLQPAAGNQTDSRRLAVLSNEIRALRDEVGQLRAGLEAMREENARLRAELENAKNAALKSDLAALRSEIIGKLNAYAAENDERFAKQNKETNTALQNVAAQVNSALAANAKQQTSSGREVVSAPKDLPESGIEYTVKPGDTLTKIAKSNQSKIDWILYANPGLRSDKLFAGQKIVIPQK